MRDRWRSLLVWVAGAVTTVIIVGVLLSTTGEQVGALAAVGAIGLALLTFVPTRFLPSAALVVLMIVPRQLYADNDLLNSFSAALILVVYWAVRASFDRQGQKAESRRLGVFIALVSALLLWMVALLGIDGSETYRVSYVASFALSITLLLLVRGQQRAMKLTILTWQLAAVAATAYAVVETLLGRNPVFDPLIAASGSEAVQHWSVYRAYVSFGHPLYAGLFLSIAVCLGVGRRLEGGRNLHLVAAGIALFGVALTVSRNSLGAAALGAAVVVVVSLFSRRSKITGIARAGIAAALVVGLALVLQSSLLQERASSAEADNSTADRNALFDLTRITAAAHDWLGAGPASAATAAAPFNPDGIYIEGAYFQLVISLGIPGLLLFVALAGSSILRALRRGRYAAGAATIAYAVSIGFSPILENHKPYLLVFGFVLWFCWGDYEDAEGSRSDEGVELSHAGRSAKSAPTR